jgi:hypothetical protein
MKICISQLRRLIKEQLLLEYKEAKLVDKQDIKDAINACFDENQMLTRNNFEKVLWQTKLDDEKNIEGGYEFEKVCENISRSLNDIVKKWYDNEVVARGKIFASKEDDKEINDKIKEVLFDKTLYGKKVTEVPSLIKFISDLDIPKNLVEKIDDLMQMTLNATEKVMSKPRSKTSEIDSLVARIENDLKSLKSKIANQDPSMSSSLDDLTTSTINKIGNILKNLPKQKPSLDDRNQASTRVESFQRKK